MSYEFEKRCIKCGALIDNNSVYCPKCGTKQTEYRDSFNQNTYRDSFNQNTSKDKVGDVSTDWLITLLLCFFVGTLGVHRFYHGKIGTGVLMLITVGGFGIWTLIDLILIILGKFTDKHGNYITMK